MLKLLENVPRGLTQEVHGYVRALAAAAGPWPSCFAVVDMLYDSIARISVLGESASAVLGEKVAVAAFGSLGRLDFHPHYSDLDPLIIVGDDHGYDRNEIRGRVLGPLLRSSPWIRVDDHAEVARRDWTAITNIDIKFPVVSLEELRVSEDPLIDSRRWQIVMESVPVYGDCLFERAHQISSECIGHRVLGASDVGDRRHIEALMSGVPRFLARFDEPGRLYKSNYKYFKTRYLREFFSFTAIVDLVMEWVDRAAGLDLTKVCAFTTRVLQTSTTAKFIRLLDLPARLNEVISGPARRRQEVCEREISAVLVRHRIATESLVEGTSSGMTRSASMMLSLALSLIKLYVECRELLYDRHVRDVLCQRPAESVNFDGRFVEHLMPGADPALRDLFILRERYLRYMSAYAEIIPGVIGRLLAGKSIPASVRGVVAAFIQRNPVPNLEA